MNIKLPKNCCLLTLPKHVDVRGTLTIAELQGDIPMRVERIFWIHGAGANVNRGEHAHKLNTELLFAVAGSFTMTVDDGTTKADIRLDSPEKGLMLGPWIWGRLHDFEPGTVVLCLCSKPYIAEGYINDYEEFLSLVNGQKA
ncbi:MAG: FdtA/QdtA family cupin domain-containing protein [Bacteroidales bacterium]|nr:FdtA/QdtA family cupin domain-containing protein [Candidatus Physcousia equi]